ncbi:MAG: hypothetical protein DRR42_03740 [Gammaproteobacteria bacterium]|nr:MAG: hypothetical protein DRR42_03740 [Gammaproteobacteria bacterium]
MKPRLLYIIGAQRSGTTLLERILSSHSMIHGGAEPHILTPLAHLGIWRKVEKAPYDTIVSALGQQAFVDNLPNREEDYWQACRAYCDVLYTQHMENSNKQLCLDKTPEYATVLPFITKVFPDAKYIVLTRHPVAVFSSFANSFFDGNYTLAQQHEPLLERYIPPIAAFLRQTKIAFLHVHYEDLVKNPESEIQRICQYLELPYESESLAYQKQSKQPTSSLQPGDPLGVQRFQGPSELSLTKWTTELKRNQSNYQFMQKLIKKLDPADLKTLGYPIDTLWQAMNIPISDTKVHAKPKFKFNRYQLERKLIIKGRAVVRRFPRLSPILKRIRLICDVLLREL